MSKAYTLESPVLVVDALGFTNRIRLAGSDGLHHLGQQLEKQFHRFRAKVPHRMMLVTRTNVFGTGEYATLRLNDMFVLHTARVMEDSQVRFLLCGSLLFQSMLLAGQIPRGGLGFGPIYRSKELLIGNGFIDAYEASERRPESSRHICAVQLSPSFLASMPNTKRAYQLLCFYEGRLYIHPWGLLDPQMGQFSPSRITALLESADIDPSKLDATTRFLEGLEDYETAMAPGSATRRMLDAAGAPWEPKAPPLGDELAG